MIFAWHVLELFSDWLKAINPFLAAIVACLKALLDARENRRWRVAYGILGALALIAFGCYSVYRLVA